MFKPNLGHIFSVVELLKLDKLQIFYGCVQRFACAQWRLKCHPATRSVYSHY